VARNLNLLAQARPTPSVSAFLRPSHSGGVRTLPYSRRCICIHTCFTAFEGRASSSFTSPTFSLGGQPAANSHLSVCSPYSPGILQPMPEPQQAEETPDHVTMTLHHRRHRLMTGGTLKRITTHRGGVSPLGGCPDVTDENAYARSRISALICGSILCILTLSALMRGHSKRLVLSE
jgi:hypothetical protein